MASNDRRFAPRRGNPREEAGAAPVRRNSVSIAQSLVLTFSLALLGVSIAHSLEDFVYGIPARFGLSVATAAVLLAAGYVVQVTGVLLALRGQRVGYLLTLATGATWAIAAALDHLGEVLTVWPYREGVISKALEVGCMLTGAVLTLASLRALFPRPAR